MRYSVCFNYHLYLKCTLSVLMFTVVSFSPSSDMLHSALADSSHLYLRGTEVF